MCFPLEIWHTDKLMFNSTILWCKVELKSSLLFIETYERERRGEERWCLQNILLQEKYSLLAHIRYIFYLHFSQSTSHADRTRVQYQTREQLNFLSPTSLCIHLDLKTNTIFWGGKRGGNLIFVVSKRYPAISLSRTRVRAYLTRQRDDELF